MARQFLETPIHEGYNEIGTIDIVITEFEPSLTFTVSDSGERIEDQSASLLFKLKFEESSNAVPPEYKGVFTLSVLVEEPSVIYEANPNEAGFMQINPNLFPVISPVTSEGEINIIRLELFGPLSTRTEECYLRVDNPDGGFLFTLIKDLSVALENIGMDTSYLCVNGGNDNYYKISPAIDYTTSSLNKLYINEFGKIYGLNASSWSAADTLQFVKIDNPETDLEPSPVDGFYIYTGGEFDIHYNQVLGDGGGGFPNSYLKLKNPEIYSVDVDVDIIDPNGLPVVITPDNFSGILLGSLDYSIIEISGEPISTADNSPTLSDLVSLGYSFPELKTFLEGKVPPLDTLHKIRNAGPINYIDSIPGGLDSQIDIVQPHVDLYAINQDAEQNKHIITSGYDTLYKISSTEKGKFITDTVSEIFPLYNAALTHEKALQATIYVSDTAAAILTDSKLASTTIPAVNGSTFFNSVVASSVNSCGCDDCQSSVSPFAYLMDLLKYGAKTLDYTGSYNHLTPNDATFTTFLEGKFKQPFATLNVDCKNLHDEYCRVRLVTEVLEQVQGAATTTTLTADRKKFYWLVYTNILSQIGTSVEELRNVYNIQGVEEKEKSARNITNRLAIPLYDIAYPTVLTTELLLAWPSTITSSFLQQMFGFRDTKASPTSGIVKSSFEKWQTKFLRDTCVNTDYSFTSYSRENFNTLLKPNWNPIIDPDIIGKEDMTYLPSNFVIDLWELRKEDTDTFLSWALENASNTTIISADIENRILRVPSKNLINHQILDGIIQIENPSTVWNDFELLTIKLNSTNSDIYLKKSTPLLPQPTMLNPVGSSPTVRYKRIVGNGTLVANGGTSYTLSFDDDVLEDVCSTDYGYLISNGDLLQIFETAPTSNILMSLSYVDSKTVDLDLSTPPSAGFLGGTDIQFTYEVEVDLYSLEQVDPRSLTIDVFQNQYSYTLLTPVPAGLPDPDFDYSIWTVPSLGWPAYINAADEYGKLQQMYSFLSVNEHVEEITLIVNENLNMEVSDLFRMMQLMLYCDSYLNSFLTVIPPKPEELYELVSLIRSSAKKVLRSLWIEEELKYVPLGGSAQELMLNAQDFWKSISTPTNGSWDPSLQTIPSAGNPILASHKPILDPELLPSDKLLRGPKAKPYRDLYFSRLDTLNSEKTTFLSLIIPFDISGFSKALNKINTGNPATAYSIAPYSGANALELMVSDLSSSDPFLRKKASDATWDAFKITSDDFLKIIEIKDLYEKNDPALLPRKIELEKVSSLFVTGYKINRLYPTISGNGWIKDEMTGSVAFTSFPVYYYNVRQMQLAPGRTDVSDRTEWQSTLAAWNRRPLIDPSIVPPENIISFVSTNWVQVKWSTRNTALTASLASQRTALTPGSYTNINVFTSLKEQIDLVIARVDSYTPLGGFEYLPYFEEIITKEILKEDIRPFLEQLKIGVSEYATLRKIYLLLKPLATNGSTAGDPAPLLESEKSDLVDILISIRRRFLYFEQVQEEYNPTFPNPILCLNSEKFKVYVPTNVNFPLTNLPIYNKWLAPYSERKEWIDILEGRTDREEGTKAHWHRVLEEADDVNMPFMRDSLIRAMTVSSESFDAAGERLAKTYFIETKDNCCVKHNRVSFAIETIQGLFFALQNGVFSTFISDFKLFAPNFSKEWEWLGSYSTWRSAMFVFLYPENILHPTLRRNQSPAFQTLTARLEGNNRLTPKEACASADQFENYFNDINNLENICSTTALVNLYVEEVNSCCESNISNRLLTFFFGQSPTTGKVYWTNKEYYQRPGEIMLDFWRPIPIEQENPTLIGCNYLGNWRNSTDALWLFYSYREKGVLKMAYLKKYLSNPKSTWVSGEMEDLPSVVGLGEIVNITACQHQSAVPVPSFILSYVNGTGYTHSHFYYNQDSNKFNVGLISPHSIDSKPKSVVMHSSGGSIAIAFSTKGYVSGGPGAFLNYNEFFALFESNEQTNKFIFIVKPGTSHMVMEVPAYGGYITTILSANIPNSIKQLEFVYPYNVESGYKGYYAAKTISGELIACRLEIMESPDRISMLQPFRLRPFLQTTPTGSPKPEVKVESADCIDNLGLRKIGIETDMKFNATPLSSLPGFTNMSVIMEYLKEAYYFGPMMIALQLQRASLYSDALNWYRSIYDYTNYNGTNRKIYYGLKAEETIGDTSVRDSKWLLDPLNPHYIAEKRTNSYSRYTITNLIQCLYSYADMEFTMDTIETVPIARKLYTIALDLLKVPELNQASNYCDTGGNLLDNSTAMIAARTWSEMYDELKTQVGLIHNADTVTTVTDDIITLFTGTTEADNSATFASSFALINAALDGEVTDPLTVFDTLEESSTEYNDALRYVMAITKTDAFYDNVEFKFNSAIAELSSIAVENVAENSSEESLSWLGESLPSNDISYQFTFSDSATGTQNMPGDFSYSPISPDAMSYKSNANNSNAGSILITITNTYSPLLGFHFCTPNNPVYKSLNLKGNLELYKIFNCRNIAGMVRELDAFAAATDSSTGIPFIGASGNLVIPGAGNFTPSQYRFKTLIERAKGLVQQAQQLESLFFSAIEKEDAENFSQLQARQGIESARATVKLQDLRVTGAQNEKIVAELQVGKAEFMQNNYNDWIAGGLSEYENKALSLLRDSQDFMKEAIGWQQAAMIAYAAQGVLATGFSSGDYLNASQLLTTVAGSVASAAVAGGSVASFNSSIKSTESSIMSQYATYERRNKEWEFQRDLAGRDLEIANQIVQNSENSIRIAGQEREIAEINVNHAEDTLEYLKTKFTNAALYRWMGNILEGCYSFMLNQATSVAKAAEGQLYFERQQQAGPFILNDYWELPSAGSLSTSSSDSENRRGLTGSARLLVDVTRLDQFAFNTLKRKLQLNKVISLAQNFPVEFQNFKETGVLNFELTNKQFDYDFPGHYIRLINSVKTSVIGLLPVYDGIKASLTTGTISYTVIGGTTFQKIPIRRLEVDSVALTSSINATGVFEMNPSQGELLNPFEGVGVESRWEFKMPQFSNRFDFSAIADVLINVEYTALDSYQYRGEVIQNLDNKRTFNRSFSIKNDFPDQWYDLAEAESGGQDFGISFELKRENFPAGIQELKLNKASDIILYFVRDDGYTEEIEVLDFSAVTNPANTSYIGGTTLNGRLGTTALMNSLGNTPIMKLRLLFDNTDFNRKLFSEGKLKDILIVVPCKAELKSYPI